MMLRGDGGGDLRVGLGKGGVGVGYKGHVFVRLIHKIEDLCQRAFDDIAAALVCGETLPDRIGNIPPVLRELTEEPDLSGVLGKQEVDDPEMVARHREDVVAALEELLGDRLAPESLQVDSKFREGLDRRLAGRGALRGAHSGGEDRDITASLDKLAHQAFGHGAAADISSADKKDGFHRPEPMWRSKHMPPAWVSGFLKSIQGCPAKGWIFEGA